jgi:hypothetical protein
MGGEAGFWKSLSVKKRHRLGGLSFFLRIFEIFLFGALARIGLRGLCLMILKNSKAASCGVYFSFTPKVSGLGVSE